MAETFTLDAASNIGSRTGPSATNTYDQANRHISDGAQSFTWSNADRLTPRGDDTFSYDALDRLTSSTVTGTTTRTYAYDGDGLLASRTQGSTTSFLWDPSSAPQRLLQAASDPPSTVSARCTSFAGTRRPSATHATGSTVLAVKSTQLEA